MDFVLFFGEKQRCNSPLKLVDFCQIERPTFVCSTADLSLVRSARDPSSAIRIRVCLERAGWAGYPSAECSHWRHRQGLTWSNPRGVRQCNRAAARPSYWSLKEGKGGVKPDQVRVQYLSALFPKSYPSASVSYFSIAFNKASRTGIRRKHACVVHAPRFATIGLPPGKASLVAAVRSTPGAIRRPDPPHHRN